MSEEQNKNVNNNQNTEKDLSDKVIESVENFMNTTDHEKDYEKDDRNVNRTAAILAYIPFVAIYYLFARKPKISDYIKFHTNQGLLVSFIWIISIVISKILKNTFIRDSYIINDIPGWVSFICYVLYCCAFLLTFFGIINTTNESS